MPFPTLSRTRFLTGSCIFCNHSYLLEKPRIVEHLKGERNYHVFYMVCKGKDVIDESTKLAKWEDFKICKQARHARSLCSSACANAYADVHGAEYPA